MHGATIVMVNLVMGPLTLDILQCASLIRHTSKYTMHAVRNGLCVMIITFTCILKLIIYT